MTRTSDPPAAAPPIRLRPLLAAIVLLAVLIGGLHGRSLRYGLFLDDHAHYAQLREAGWSLKDLAAACRLELVGGTIDYWWMPRCTLRFFRPLSFAAMKLVYTLFDWNPAANHAASLLWHLAACTLLMLLIYRLGIPAWIAAMVAAWFAIHPGHVATVQWIASQTELIVTTLVLGALLCFGNFRGWFGPPATGRAAAGWAAASVVLFALALGCRENAVMFPFVAAAMELWAPRQRRRQAWLLLAVFGVMIAVYLAIRSSVLGGAAVPPKPYVMPPADPEFPRYIFDKVCYYLLGEFLLVPCVPMGGLAYFRAHPVAFYGLTAAVVATIGWVALRSRMRFAAALGTAALFGLMVPVLPSFESPHHLYLPGVGWAILAALLLYALAGYRADRPDRLERPPRLRGARVFAVLTAVLFGMLTYWFGMSLDTAQQVEDRVFAEIAESPTPIREHETIYIANLPMIAHYVKLGVAERTGLKDIRVVALTWAPRLLWVTSRSELKWIDDRTIELWVEPDRYFAGPFGNLVRLATGRRLPVEPGKPVRTDDFVVEYVAGDEDGIAALRFTFFKPLDREGVHLFYGSRTRWATQILPRWGEK